MNVSVNPPRRAKAGSRRHSRGMALARSATVAVEALEARTLLSWTPLVRSAPGGIGTMLLLPNGTVMAQINGISADWALLTPDATGSYVNGTWSRLASMHDTRLYDASQVLQDGRVFVAGGEYGTGSRTGETYNPLTNTWTQLPAQSFGNILDAMSDTLPDGRVLIGPVSPSSSGFTIIFNPATNSWAQGPKTVRGGSTDEQNFTKLPDGSILTVDGNTTSERYIPSLNQWVNDAAVPVPLFDSKGELGPGVLLADGRVFYLGATPHTAIYTPSGSTAPGSWVAGPDIPNGLGDDDAPAAVLRDGKVLCVAGPSGTYNGPTSFFIYDPVSNSFSPAAGAPTVTGPVFTERMLALPDGNVLFTSGGSNAYVFNPGTAALPESQPTITDVSPDGDGSYTLSGTGLNGISEGAYYGDDAQMSSNYPLVRLTGPTGTVYYARTFGWSSTGLQTGAATLTTKFVLPIGIPPGTYTLAAVANGVTSDPTTFTISTTDPNTGPTVNTAAHAAPVPVTGTTTVLSALGDDDNGEANLVYTWHTTSSPSGSQLPSFSVNGSNAAKDTTVTFHHVGSYTFRVTMTDAGGLSITSTVSVTVTATMTSLTVSPAKSTITSGGTQQLSAQALDQFGLTMTTPAVTWAVTSGGGTISSPGGKYTAPASGTLATITATAGGVPGTAQVGVVTSPWASQDVGSVGATGIASDSGGTFTIQGAGADIWNTADEFRYVYRQLSGDVAITARVASQQNTNASAKSGVMIRNTLGAADQYAIMAVTPGSGTTFQYRATSGANAIENAKTAGIVAPYWVRLVRVGNTFSAYRSSNGTTWVPQGTQSITMGTTVYVGLAVCSHNDATLNTSTFSNVTVSQPSVATAAKATPNPVTTGTTTALSVLGADAAGEAALTYTWATTSGPGGGVANPTFSVNGTNAAKNATVTFKGAGTYQFTCTISDGVLSKTSAVSVTVNAALATIAVAPSPAPNVSAGGTQQFTATGIDQFGAPLASQPAFTWAVTGAQNTIDGNGLFTAGRAAGTYTVTASGGGIGGTADVTVVGAAVTTRALFYHGSAYDAAGASADDDAIDPTKAALLPGQAAAAVNYGGYAGGINGIIIDLAHSAHAADITAADFAFVAGAGGDPANWGDAPPLPAQVRVRPGDGANGADRIELIWDDGAIVDRWLKVTVKATAATELVAPDVFYFGNLVGDTGNDAGATAIVSAMDLANVRAASVSGVPPVVGTAADLNKDGVVDAADTGIVRANYTHSLALFTAPTEAPPEATPSPTVAAATTPLANAAPASPAVIGASTTSAHESAAAPSRPPITSIFSLRPLWPSWLSAARRDLLDA
jgi:regulation of enolase protein 1 (concanavalin A-like superfamily)